MATFSLNWWTHPLRSLFTLHQFFTQWLLILCKSQWFFSDFKVFHELVPQKQTSSCTVSLCFRHKDLFCQYLDRTKALSLQPPSYTPDGLLPDFLLLPWNFSSRVASFSFLLQLSPPHEALTILLKTSSPISLVALLIFYTVLFYFTQNFHFPKSFTDSLCFVYWHFPCQNVSLISSGIFGLPVVLSQLLRTFPSTCCFLSICEMINEYLKGTIDVVSELFSLLCYFSRLDSTCQRNHALFSYHKIARVFSSRLSLHKYYIAVLKDQKC